MTHSHIYVQRANPELLKHDDIQIFYTGLITEEETIIFPENIKEML